MLRALVVGRAACVWDDVAAARQLGSFDTTLVVGRVGIDYSDHVDHWVTFHLDLLERWVEQRRARGHSDVLCYWGVLYRGRPLKSYDTIKLPVRLVRCDGGSSGRIAAHVALTKLLADRVVLAGVPMTREGGHYDEPGEWREAENYRAEWEQDYTSPAVRDKMRSMSGWTRNLFGAPTREWLLGP